MTVLIHWSVSEKESAEGSGPRGGREAGSALSREPGGWTPGPAGVTWAAGGHPDGAAGAATADAHGPVLPDPQRRPLRCCLRPRDP